MSWNPPRGIYGPVTKTASGVTDAVIPPLANHIYLLLNITAVAGALPTLSVGIEWSHDGGTTWATGDPTSDQFFSSFSILNTVTAKVKKFAVAGTLYRIRWIITGTLGQSFTFSLSEYTTV